MNAVANPSESMTGIPQSWLAPVLAMPAIVGPVWPQIQVAFLSRLREYVKQGFTPDDVLEGCIGLSMVECHSRCEWPNDWLKLFANSLIRARDSRRIAERIAKDREAAQAYENRTIRERHAVAEMLRKWQSEFATQTALPVDVDGNETNDRTREFLKHARSMKA